MVSTPLAKHSCARKNEVLGRPVLVFIIGAKVVIRMKSIKVYVPLVFSSRTSFPHFPSIFLSKVMKKHSNSNLYRPFLSLPVVSHTKKKPKHNAMPLTFWVLMLFCCFVCKAILMWRREYTHAFHPYVIHKNKIRPRGS